MTNPPQPQTKPQSQIRKIRERNKQLIGLLQEKLHDCVGYSNYIKCENIVTITAAMKTLIECESILSACIINKNKK